jgi:hypothetical protein
LSWVVHGGAVVIGVTDFVAVAVVALDADAAALRRGGYGHIAHVEELDYRNVQIGAGAVLAYCLKGDVAEGKGACGSGVEPEAAQTHVARVIVQDSAFRYARYAREEAAGVSNAIRDPDYGPRVAGNIDTEGAQARPGHVRGLEA